MNPFHARIGSLLLAALWFGQPLGAQAAEGRDGRPPELWYQGSRLILPTSVPADGDLLVASNDTGLQTFLARLGATIAYQSGLQFVVVTTADRRQITFTVGESDLRINGVLQSGPFAIQTRGEAVGLPFYTLIRALDIVAKPSAGQIVLEPDITALDAHVDHGRTVVILHAAVPLHPESLPAEPGHVVLRLRGVGTTLDSRPTVRGPGLRTLSVIESGTVRNPVTILHFVTNAGAKVGRLLSPDPHGAVLAFAPANVDVHAPLLAVVAPPDTEAATPAPADSPRVVATVAPQPTTQNITPPAVVSVSALDEKPQSDAFTVRLAVSGQPQYRWRVLGDGRFFIDIPGAALALATRDEALDNPHVSALRLRANGTPQLPNVRLALSLIGPQSVHVASDQASLTITVGKAQYTNAGNSGLGRVGSADIPAPSITPAAAAQPLPSSVIGGPPRLPNGTNRRLIVLDPGHGGSDSGAVGNGLTEKVLTLDIARRLRDVLVARGWQVMLTHDRDVDVYAPNDSAREELQARCDVANRAGARMFVSLHINSFTSSDLQGTTTYYYKPTDARFAQIIDQRLVAALGTQDDGARRENFYVVRHTTMPAILVETAFLSNAADAARLNRPEFRQQVAEAIGSGITAYSAEAVSSPTLLQGNADTPLAVPAVDDLAP